MGGADSQRMLVPQSRAKHGTRRTVRGDGFTVARLEEPAEAHGEGFRVPCRSRFPRNPRGVPRSRFGFPLRVHRSSGNSRPRSETGPGAGSRPQCWASQQWHTMPVVTAEVVRSARSPPRFGRVSRSETRLWAGSRASLADASGCGGGLVVRFRPRTVLALGHVEPGRTAGAAGWSQSPTSLVAIGWDLVVEGGGFGGGVVRRQFSGGAC
jgi:hypothetical protein